MEEKKNIILEIVSQCQEEEKINLFYGLLEIVMWQYIEKYPAISATIKKC